ncbi:hypothetical protein [Variovorax sp. KK3]|uniref:hypothetical protein n=1 Tax=Variovorax sp. KK3 TaxID=1855728 RepID=UPI00097BE8C5|nr:hypothetical protein [Variovorax sp. KK3]
MSSSVELQKEESLYQLLAVYSNPDGMQELRERASLSVGGIDAEGASFLKKKLSEWAVADLNAELEKALTPDPFSLLAKAWVQVREVREAVKASKGPPAVAKAVKLLKHEVEAKLEPRLVLKVSGVDWCSVKLAIELKLNFDAVELEWMDGRLAQLKSGNPAGSISLKCADQEIKAFKRELKIKAHYRFEKPVEISAPAVAAPVPATATASA